MMRQFGRVRRATVSRSMPKVMKWWKCTTSGRIVLRNSTKALDQQRLAQLVPPMIVVPAEEQEFVLPAVEAGDASARLEQTQDVLSSVEASRTGLDVGPFAQFLEQFVSDLLCAAAHKFGMMQADQQNLGHLCLTASGLPAAVASRSVFFAGCALAICGRGSGTAATTGTSGTTGAAWTTATAWPSCSNLCRGVRPTRSGTIVDFPGAREQPAVQQRPAFMLRQPARAFPLEMPHSQIVQPGRDTCLQALQAQIGVLVMTEHIILGEAAELFEPGTVDRDEGPGDRGHRPRCRVNCAAQNGRALAVMLHANQVSTGDRRPAPVWTPTSTSKYMPPCISVPSS